MMKADKKSQSDTMFASRTGGKKHGAGRRDVIRILIAEDHTVVRDGLVAIIKQEQDMDVVAETGDVWAL